MENSWESSKYMPKTNTDQRYIPKKVIYAVKTTEVS